MTSWWFASNVLGSLTPKHCFVHIRPFWAKMFFQINSHAYTTCFTQFSRSKSQIPWIFCIVESLNTLEPTRTRSSRWICCFKFTCLYIDIFVFLMLDRYYAYIYIYIYVIICIYIYIFTTCKCPVYVYIYIYMYICIYVCLYEFYGLWNRDLWESCQTWEPWRWHLLRWQLKPRKMNCDRFGRWESWEGFCCKWFCLTLPETNSKSTWKWMVGTLVFFWHGMFNWGGLFFFIVTPTWGNDAILFD